jgi:quinol monooxygenase YgiN
MANLIQLSIFGCLLLVCSCVSNTRSQNEKELVRLAVIEVDSAQLVIYNNFLKEEIEASIRIEPGVLTLYAVAEKARPTHVTIFETYADSSQYRAHLTTPHFQKYKTGTLDMVQDLQLIETKPIIYVHKKNLATENKDLLIRMIKLEVDSAQLEDYKRIVSTFIAPGVEKEAGLLTMYAVSEKSRPTHITVLEIYANSAAYDRHLKTSHFIKYKSATEHMVKSLQILEVTPIYLGAKDSKPE